MAAPKKGDEAKRQIITMRVTSAVRERIHEAAEANARSVSQEIESRLEMSFREDRLMGGASTALLGRLISGNIGLIELETGRPWTEDRQTWEAVRSAVGFVLDTMKPSIPDEIWHGHREEFWSLLQRVGEVVGLEDRIDGLRKAFPGIDSHSEEHPSEVVALLREAKEALPPAYAQLSDAVARVRQGPLAAYEETAKESRKLGREIAGSGRNKATTNVVFLEGWVRLFLKDGKIEPLTRTQFLNADPDLQDFTWTLAEGIVRALKSTDQCSLDIPTKEKLVGS